MSGMCAGSGQHNIVQMTTLRVRAHPRLAVAGLLAVALAAAHPGTASAGRPGAGVTTRASVSEAGVEGNGTSLGRDISADGRFVTFESTADNLVPGDTNGTEDVFVRDRQLGTTELVSAAWIGGSADDTSHGGSISDDGRAVAFYSFASDLVAPPGISALGAGVYVREGGRTTLVSVGCSTPGVPCGHSQDPAISGDGRYVVFRSFGPRSQVYVHDRSSGSTRLVSATPGGAPGNGTSGAAEVSADGTTIVFTSMASDLVDEPEPGGGVFVFDATTGRLSRVSNVHRWGGGWPKVSADGRFVAFTSFLPELPDDTNTLSDAYVRDRLTGGLVRVSGDDANGRTDSVAISPDGRFVAFTSAATNLVKEAKDDTPDLFLRDLSRPAPRWTLLSVGPDGTEAGVEYWGGGASLATGADHVAFTSAAALVAEDGNDLADVFVRSRS